MHRLSGRQFEAFRFIFADRIEQRFDRIDAAILRQLRKSRDKGRR